MMEIKEYQVDENTWSYGFPYRSVFIEATLVEEEVKPQDALTLLSSAPRDYCRVSINTVHASLLSKATLGKLVAECPCCKGGQKRVLRADRFIGKLDIFDDLLAAQAYKQDPYDELSRSPVPDLRAQVSEFNRWIGEVVQLCNDRDYSLNTFFMKEENIFGLDLNQVKLHNPAQLRIPFDNMAAEARTLGLQSLLIGAYVCPQCNTAFGIVYNGVQCDPNSALGEKGSEILDSLLEHLDITGPSEAALDLQVSKEPEGIRISANVNNEQAALFLNARTGLLEIDGICNISVSYKEHQEYECPIVENNLLRFSAIQKRVTSLMPHMAGCLSENTDNRSMAILDKLVLGNRFIGYPASFYKEVLANKFLFRKAYPLGSGLPRNYADIEPCYEASGLPRTKALRRLLFERPALLFMVSNFPDLPFKDINVLRRFLSLKHSPDLILHLCQKPNVVFVLQVLRQAKGDAALLNYLEALSISDLGHLLDAINYSSIKSLRIERDKVARCRLKHLGLLFHEFCWKRDNPGRLTTENYEHSDEELSYEGSQGGFTFSLAKSPKDVFTAANKLHNCLRNVEYRYARKSCLLFVVRKGKRIVAAVECSYPENETNAEHRMLVVREARAVLNGSLDRIEGLPEAFEAWRQTNNIGTV